MSHTHARAPTHTHIQIRNRHHLLQGLGLTTEQATISKDALRYAFEKVDTHALISSACFPLFLRASHCSKPKGKAVPQH